MQGVVRVYNVKQINKLRENNSLNINLIVDKDFEFPNQCQYLFVNWEGDIEFEKGIDTSNVINMHSMFRETKGNITGLEHFDMSNVKDIDDMFYKNEIALPNITNWDLKNVKSKDRFFSPKRFLKIYKEYLNLKKGKEE